MARVIEWAATQDFDAAGVTRALERSPEAAQWAELLRELGRCAPETLYSIKINLHEALACWEDPAVMRRIGPEATDLVDPVDLIRRDARIFVLASGDGHVTPLVTVLVSALVEAAKDEARSRLTARGRLDPPLGLFLDECTKVCPLPQLPELVSDGGSQGIVSFVVLQSVDQAERAWGQRWRTIWGAANVHIVMGKVSDLDTQRAISAMAPEVQVEERRSGRDRHGLPFDPVVRFLPALSTDEISAIPPHTAVVFYGRRPMRVDMPRVDSRRSRHRKAAYAARAAWRAWLAGNGLGGRRGSLP
jgi:type IV secretory pathway TraG/TraD family ATPase VirD4